LFHALEAYLIPWLEQLYRSVGYLGLALAMGIESACIPLPSELVLPLAGWMVSLGIFSFWPAVLTATIGGTLGSILAYWVGALGGRPLLLRYGRYVLISQHEIEIAERWFARYGEATAFFSRLLPVVRTFISLPAGISRMSFPRFVLYTFLGSLPWSAVLVYVGVLLQSNWETVRAVLAPFDYVIVLVVVAAIAYFVYRRVTSLRSVGSRPIEKG
jgi:membrane protein DedA with SNARE-associated domain